MGSAEDTLVGDTVGRDQTILRHEARRNDLRLLVVGDGTSEIFPLPADTTVIIGRGQDAEISIDDPSISRRHAQLKVGDTLSIEDLGSANGTVVRSERLEPGHPVDITPGVAVEVGSKIVIVQGHNAQRRPGPRNTSGRPRRIGTHDYFEVRLEEACAEAEAERSSFTVLRIHADDGMEPVVLADTVLEALEAGIPVASYGPGELEAILLNCTKEQATPSKKALEGAFQQRKSQVQIGMATYPEDGRSPETLLERASAGALGITGEEGSSEIVVQDRVMQSLHQLLARVATGNINVLLLGETGVGKEVLAEAVHRNSPRIKKPFVKMNCAAMTETLFESELFGHQKGAFTGAVKTKKGLLEAADGGTFFLDEIGEMPASIQAKLLTVIEDRKVLPVGGIEPKSIDVRFVAATNRDLEDEVSRGRFRQDLFYRLNGISLLIPPLRERTTEIEGLTKVFINRAVKQMGLSRSPKLSAPALDALKRYTWPGNIRELRNILERAVLLCTGDQIEPQHFPLEKMHATVVAGSASSPAAPTPAPSDATSDLAHQVTPPQDHRPKLRRGVAPVDTPEWHAERDLILKALDDCAGNQSEAAKYLQISRRTLVSRLVAYKIPRPRKPLPGEEKS